MKPLQFYLLGVGVRAGALEGDRADVEVEWTGLRTYFDGV